MERMTALSVAAVAALAACSAPDPEFKKPSAPIEIIRDDFGVPHVYAHDADDAFFALGYATAQDRLFELDVNRRRVLGRASELFGKDSLANDRIARVLGFGALGEQMAEDLRKNDPTVYRGLSAYAAGINKFIAEASADALSVEFADLGDPTYRPEPWKVSDTLAMLKGEMFVLAVHPETDVMAYAIETLEFDGANVYRDLWRPDPLEAVYVTGGFPDAKSQHARRHVKPSPRPFPAGRGGAGLSALAKALANFAGRQRIGPVAASNNWALCGAATASGAPMFANDPHLEVDLPTNLYEVHVESDEPGKPLRAAGFVIPGMPAFVNGHNDAFAFGVTTTEADIAETYIEQTDADASLFNGAMVPMQVRSETIRIRRDGGALSDFDEVPQRVRVVPHHGPVISDAVDDLAPFLGSKALSVKWLGFGITHEPRAYYELFRARSYADFRAALGHFESGLLNFVYAGADGDIGYFPRSSYPIRARLDPKNPPYGPVPGGGSFEWTGALIPDERIPQLHNPDSCRVFTANNDPAGVTADGDLLDDPFYLGGTFDYALRARRIRDRLDALQGKAATLDDFEAMQADVHSGLADHFLPLLFANANASALSPQANAHLTVLKSWDREDRVDSPAPTIFYAWYSQLIADVFADDLALTFDQVATDDRVFARPLERLLNGEPLPSGHDYLGGKSPGEYLRGALEKVAASLGPNPPAWGVVHTQTFNHPLGSKYSLGPFAMPGGLCSVNAARYSPLVGGKPAASPDVTEAPNVRMIVDLSPGNVQMRAALPTGESGNPGSTHYTDQMQLWLQAKTRASYFARDEVLAHQESMATLR